MGEVGLESGEGAEIIKVQDIYDYILYCYVI